MLLVCACLLQKEWESVLTLVLAMMMFQAQSDYIYCLFLLPLLLFIAQEGQLNRNNLLPFAVMVLFTVHLPLFHGTRGTMLLVRNLFFQALFVVLLVWCVVRAWKSVPRKQALRSWRLQAFGRWEKRATVLVAALVLVANVAGLQIWERTHNWGFDYGLYTGIDERDNKQFTLRDQTTGKTGRWFGARRDPILSFITMRRSSKTSISVLPPGTGWTFPRHTASILW